MGALRALDQDVHADFTVARMGGRPAQALFDAAGRRLARLRRCAAAFAYTGDRRDRARGWPRRAGVTIPKRGFIALFLFSLTAINYIDRLALSMAAKPVAEEFH